MGRRHSQLAARLRPDRSRRRERHVQPDTDRRREHDRRSHEQPQFEALGPDVAEARPGDTNAAASWTESKPNSGSRGFDAETDSKPDTARGLNSDRDPDPNRKTECKRPHTSNGNADHQTDADAQPDTCPNAVPDRLYE